jgi:hypothetical protein
MKIMVGRGSLQFNVGYEPQQTLGILHFPKVFLCLEDVVKASVCKQNLGNVEE